MEIIELASLIYVRVLGRNWDYGCPIFNFTITRTANVATGTVKFFNAAKHFGFIKPDDGEHDVFVHASAAEGAGLQLQEGMRVGFNLEADRKTGKPQAAKLRLL